MPEELADVIDNPITREECYLSAILQRDVEPPKPVTRSEYYLYAILEMVNYIIEHLVPDEDDGGGDGE